MRKLSLLIVLFVALSIIPESTFAQQATEIYIPIGSSPGLSQNNTWQGTIEALDGEMTLSVQNEAGTSRSIKLDQNTKIWLDKSSIKTKNEVGDQDDCKPGAVIEVKYRDNDASKAAEWIKVKVDA